MSLPKPTPDSIALITGASGGIGEEVARELARRGHAVALVARRKERLEALAKDLKSEYGVRTETIAADLAKPASRSRIQGRITELGLEVDILVNNAGFATGGAFHESEATRELEQVRVLVEAVVALTTTFLPPMVKQRRGAILNVASTAAMQPLPYAAGYSAAKAYVLAFSEAIHQEVVGRGVTVTALCPGPVDTEFWQIADWEVAGRRTSESALPSLAMISAKDAALAGVDGLDSGNRVVIPGLPMRAAMLATRYIPHAVKLPVVERVMRGR
jgi:short-subunit dehydrogenase